jgi:protein-S-isoprenylcysteine O-methyltransferase Ste14
MNMRLRSYFYVAVQLAAIGFIVCTGPILTSRLWCQVVEVGGLALGAWAVTAMGLRQLRAAPDVAAQARLVVNGPYRWIRHPMYAAVLLITAVLVTDNFTWWRLIVWLVLLLNLLEKLHFEETMLMQQFPEYAAYRQRTKRLIPFVLGIGILFADWSALATPEPSQLSLCNEYRVVTWVSDKADYCQTPGITAPATQRSQNHSRWSPRSSPRPNCRAAKPLP